VDFEDVEIEELRERRAELAATHWRGARQDIKAERAGLSFSDKMEAQAAKLRGIGGTVACFALSALRADF
jgi:hypothetical protein